VPKQYPSIQSALNAAQSGDRVLIAAGTYIEGSASYHGNGFPAGLNIRQKSNLTIRGDAAATTVVDLNSNHFGLMLDACTNITVENLTIVNSRPQSWGAAHFFNGSTNCALDHVLIRIPDPWYSIIDAYVGGNGLRFCTVIGEDADAVFNFAQLQVAFKVENSVICYASDLATGSNPVTIDRSCIWAINDSSQVSGNGNLFGDPIFVAPQIGDFRITLNTPCATASSTGGPIGALGAGEGDCDHDGVPDAVEVANGERDCDGDGFPDACAIAAGIAMDCDVDGLIDSCAIASGGASDLNGDAIPDNCQCIADLFVDGQVNGADLGVVLAQWGQGAGAAGDINRDGTVGAQDLSILLSSWGTCP
jgi:hypothetical protein